MAARIVSKALESLERGCRLRGMSEPTLHALQSKKRAAQVWVKLSGARVETTRCLEFTLKFTALPCVEVRIRIDAFAVGCTPKARQCMAWITKKEVTERLAVLGTCVAGTIVQDAIQ
jgi:hypothetical protein